MDCSIIKSVEEFEALKEEWDVLAGPYQSPLLEHDWLAAATHTLLAEDEPRVHVVRQQGRLCAAAPLVRDRLRGRLTLIGGMKLYEPCGWLFTSNEAAAELAKACVKDVSCLLLQRVPAALGGVLSAALRGRAIVFDRAHPSSYAVEICGSWEEYASRLSKHLRRSLRNLESRAGRDFGRCTFTVHSPTSDSVTPLLEELIRVEHSGWKGRNGSSLYGRSDLRSFFADYARRAARRGRLRVAELRFGERTAAMELAVEAHRRWWSLKIGYDEAFASLSPAIQLTHASIRTAHERGLQSYEFLGVAEAWQERWRPVSREYGLLAIYPFSVLGVSTLARDAWASLTAGKRTSA